MHWAAAYLGKPWQAGAIGPDAYDCWGLVRAIYRERLALEVPPAGGPQGINGLKAQLREFQSSPLFGLFDEVETPRDMDAALIVQATHPLHVGLWLDVDGGKVIHCTKQAGVVAQDMQGLNAHGFRVLRWYRPKA